MNPGVALKGHVAGLGQELSGDLICHQSLERCLSQMLYKLNSTVDSMF